MRLAAVHQADLQTVLSQLIMKNAIDLLARTTVSDGRHLERVSPPVEPHQLLEHIQHIIKEEMYHLSKESPDVLLMISDRLMEQVGVRAPYDGMLLVTFLGTCAVCEGVISHGCRLVGQRVGGQWTSPSRHTCPIYESGSPPDVDQYDRQFAVSPWVPDGGRRS